MSNDSVGLRGYFFVCVVAVSGYNPTIFFVKMYLRVLVIAAIGEVEK